MVDKALEEYPFNLGEYKRLDVRARDPLTMEWFQRGLKWMFAFHHEEAIRCFERALEHEPDFAMAYWGISHCHSPNYNVHKLNGYYQLSDTETGFPSQKVAFDAIQQALKYKHQANEAGRALIEAQRIRCFWPSNDFVHLLLQPYCEALRLIHVSYPEDEDIACLYVEALMQLTPWQLFDRETGTPAQQVPEVQKILEAALEKSPRHPGLCHLAIHLYEMSPTLEIALPQAKLLRDGLVPDAGHLMHMPSHLDVQIGEYGAGVLTSEKAVIANKKYLEYAKKTGDEFKLYIGYISHDYHMLCYAAILGGMEQKAIQAARDLMTFVQESVQRYPQRAIDLDLYHATLFHVWIRFGKWQEIIEHPFFQDEESFCATNAVLHYARGIAFAALGQVGKAKHEQAAFEHARSVEKVYRRILHNNNGTELFAVSSKMLAGEIEYREGKTEKAFQHLRKAVELEDNLPYDEPWGQMQPIRHALGALLLEQNQVEEAEAVFRKDLARYPRNPWALVGLLNCLKKTQPDAAELASVQEELDRAMQISDCAISTSCACAGLKILSNV